jgi:hypothetical protein
MRRVGLVLLIVGAAAALYAYAVDLRSPGGQTINLVFVTGAMIVVGAVLVALGALLRRK